MSNAAINEVELQGILGDQYALIEQLGRGAYGTVFKARQRSTDQAVAIKVQCLDADDDPDTYAVRLGRFERESKLCAHLAHPHIVRILEKGQRGRYCFIVFEFVPGETLTDVLSARGALSVGDTVLLMGQVLDALESAHAQGVVHRDLKPDNLMLVRTATQQYIKVLDFGIGAFLTRPSDLVASLTQSQEVLGTPCYSAPEQLRGEPATPKSDIYAWALVFLECLTGRRAMEGSTLAEIFHRQLSALEIPLPAAVAAHPLGDLLRGALSKDARSRTGDARRLRVALRRLRISDLVGTIVPVSSKSVADTIVLGAKPQREHRHATILSCTLDVSALDHTADDVEVLDALQHDQLSLCADIAARFGGHSVGSLGNRLVIAFGALESSDSDARRAARAALEMTSRIEARRPLLAAQRGVQLELHIGIHTDTVILDASGALSGPALNLAARLEGLSRGGVPLVSKATHTLVHRHLHLQPAERAAGSKDPVYQLLAERSADALHARPDDAGSSRVVGRERELELLRQYFDSAAHGKGQVVLLRGEAGIGKSRLANELRASALAAGAMSLEAACLPEDSNTALCPLRPLVQHALAQAVSASGTASDALDLLLRDCELNGPEFGLVLRNWLSSDGPASTAIDHLPSDRQREILLECLTRMLPCLAGARGAVLLLEDLHWCDPTTLELVARLVPAIGERPLLVVLTARPGFAGLPEAVPVVDLGRLDREAVERMVQAGTSNADLSPDTIQRIIELTDGVPLFVEELTRAVVERESSLDIAHQVERMVPASLRELLNSRLDRLGQAKSVAQLAAAIGREFELDVLRAVSNLDPETLQGQLDVLAQSDLIRQQRQASGARYLFRHALIREAAWESMPSSQRRTVHATIVDELERR